MVEGWSFNTVFIPGMLKIEMIKMMMGSIKAWIKQALVLRSSDALEEFLDLLELELCSLYLYVPDFVKMLY